MDWIHCNNCFLQPGCGKKFYFTSCGHIFCIDCKDKCYNGLCKCCGQQFSIMQITAKMRPEIEDFFIDPDELIRKNFNKLIEITEFQKNHRIRLMAYHRKQLDKLKTMNDILKKAKEVDKERKRLKAENENLKKLISIALQGTPEMFNLLKTAIPSTSKSQNVVNICPQEFASPEFTNMSYYSTHSNTSKNNKIYLENPKRNEISLSSRSKFSGFVPRSSFYGLKELNLNSGYKKENDHFQSPLSNWSNSSFLTCKNQSFLSPTDQISLKNKLTKTNTSYSESQRQVIVHPFNQSH